MDFYSNPPLEKVEPNPLFIKVEWSQNCYYYFAPLFIKVDNKYFFVFYYKE